MKLRFLALFASLSLLLVGSTQCKLEISDEPFSGALSILGKAYDNNTGAPVDVSGATITATMGDLTLTGAPGEETNSFRIDGVPTDSTITVSITGLSDYFEYEDFGYGTDPAGTQFQSDAFFLTGNTTLDSAITVQVYDYFGSAVTSGTILMQAWTGTLPDSFQYVDNDFSASGEATFAGGSLVRDNYEIYLVDGADSNGLGYEPDLYLGSIDLSEVTADDFEFLVFDYTWDDTVYPDVAGAAMILDSATNVQDDGNGNCNEVTLNNSGQIVFTFPQPVLLNYFDPTQAPTFTEIGCGGAWNFSANTFTVAEATALTDGTGSNTITLSLSGVTVTTDVGSCTLEIDNWNFDVRYKAFADNAYDADDLFVKTAAALSSPGCTAFTDEWELVP